MKFNSISARQILLKSFFYCNPEIKFHRNKKLMVRFLISRSLSMRMVCEYNPYHVLSVKTNIWNLYNCCFLHHLPLSIQAFFPFVGCLPCTCDTDGTVDSSNTCDNETGQCNCIPNVAGRDCSVCQTGFYGKTPQLCTGKL